VPDIFLGKPDIVGSLTEQPGEQFAALGKWPRAQNSGIDEGFSVAGDEPHIFVSFKHQGPIVIKFDFV
jgi:hypothetical protein